jgi:hypothetical protein
VSPDAIKAAREEMGMTIASFAFWLGLEGAHGRTAVREMETGKRSASGPIRRAIKAGLDLHRVRAAIEDLTLDPHDTIVKIEAIVVKQPTTPHSAGHGS